MGRCGAPRAEGRTAGGLCSLKGHLRRSNLGLCPLDYSAGQGEWGGKGDWQNISHNPSNWSTEKWKLHVLKWCLWFKIHCERSEIVVTNTSEIDMNRGPDSNWWLKFDLFDFSCVISIISLRSFESRSTVGCKNLLQTFIVRMVIEF